MSCPLITLLELIMIKCTGIGCSAVNGYGHSIECQVAHSILIFENAGNRNPEARYAGYKCRPLHENATNDQREAWAEGFKAREL